MLHILISLLYAAGRQITQLFLDLKHGSVLSVGFQLHPVLLLEGSTKSSISLTTSIYQIWSCKAEASRVDATRDSSKLTEYEPGHSCLRNLDGHTMN